MAAGGGGQARAAAGMGGAGPGGAGAGGGGEVALACYQGVDRRSAGFRLLERMGWREGRGLGAQEQGITAHIRVKRPRDGEGVGQREADARVQDWTRQAAAFDRVLSGLKAHSSRDDLQAAAAEGGEGDEKSRKRAKRQAEKEARRAEKRAAKEEKKAAKRARKSAHSAAATPRAASHLGRYKKREAGKNVRSYSAGDLAQILGIQPSELPQQPAAKAGAGGEVKPPRVVVEVQLPPAARQEYVVPPVPSNWWGRRIFSRAGIVGDGSEGKQKAEASREEAQTGFKEEDQERLFMRAQEASQKGKKGLGRGALPELNLGNDWKGQRVTFGEDGDAAGADGGDAKAKKVKKEKKQKKGERKDKKVEKKEKKGKKS